VIDINDIGGLQNDRNFMSAPFENKTNDYQVYFIRILEQKFELL
jgi:hypothetical protein